MVKVTYVESSGTRHAIEVPAGFSLMEGAVKNAVPGIEADCGGAGACATCQVFIPEPWQALLPPRSDLEEVMLEMAPGANDSSRLACQIAVTEDLDGLTIDMPKSQY